LTGQGSLVERVADDLPKPRGCDARQPVKRATTPLRKPAPVHPDGRHWGTRSRRLTTDRMGPDRGWVKPSSRNGAAIASARHAKGS